MRSSIMFRVAFIAALISASTAQAQAQSSVEVYEYDALGRLTSKVDSEARASYDYDDADNREDVTQRLLFPVSWLAVNLPHNGGYAEAGGWAATVSQSPSHITYGPYARNIATGSNVAVWKMMIDDVTGLPDDNVVTIDVFNASTGQLLAIETIERRQWFANQTYQMFELPFVLDASSAGDAIEFRTFYHASSYVRIEKIGYYQQ